jgi:hypothetical protein
MSEELTPAQCVNFLASVIRSGEPFTPSVERAVSTLRQALASQPAAPGDWAERADDLAWLKELRVTLYDDDNPAENAHFDRLIAHLSGAGGGHPNTRNQDPFEEHEG